jgi:hypothetical protein
MARALRLHAPCRSRRGGDQIENPREGGDVSRAVGPHFHAPGDRPGYLMLAAVPELREMQAIAWTALFGPAGLAELVAG